MPPFESIGAGRGGEGGRNRVVPGNNPDLAPYQRSVRCAVILGTSAVALFVGCVLTLFALRWAPRAFVERGWAALVPQCGGPHDYFFVGPAAGLWWGVLCGSVAGFFAYYFLLRCPFCGRFPLPRDSEGGIPLVLTVSHCASCDQDLR